MLARETSQMILSSTSSDPPVRRELAATRPLRAITKRPANRLRDLSRFSRLLHRCAARHSVAGNVFFGPKELRPK